MSVSIKNDKLSKEQTYELEEVQSVQRDHASVTYETLDTIYPEFMKEHSGHSMVAGCGTSDGHETHLLQTNKSSGRKLLFVVTSIATFAVLLVALAVLLGILLSSAATEAEEERCSPITEVSNGTVVNFTGSGHGDTFQVQCNNASKLVGPALVMCYSSNQWSHLPRCVPKTCDPFVPPNHGKISFKNTSTTIGATILITCNDGFARNGTETVVCQKNETWSESPVCMPADCGSPKKVANGKLSGMTGTIYKSTFDVVCSKGYQLVGEATVTCNIDSRWSDTPSCKPISCGVPGIPRDGHIKHMNDTMFGSIAILGCDENFSIRGHPTLNCTADGKWTPLPYCERKDGEAVEVSRNSTWDDRPGTNTEHCGIPYIPINGYLVSKNGTIFQSRAFVRCAMGFTMIGNASIRCLSNGSWSDSPKCVPVSCGLPDEPLNGAVDAITGTTYGKTAEIKCNKGFILSGSDVITCLSNGKWTQGAICHPTVTDCYDIQKSANKTPSGIYNVTLWSSRQMIQVYCDMDTDGGGWTVFQNRYDGSVDFYNSYEQYENGFGNLNGEFWLGLKYIEEMSIQGRTKLRIDLTAADNSTAYLNYRGFFLSPKESGYMLNVGGYSGSLSYSTFSFHRKNNGMQFSTYNYSPYGNNGTTCAVNHRGAWWYDHIYCYGYAINLNGYYATPGRGGSYGMVYYAFMRNGSLKMSKMMMKRF